METIIAELGVADHARFDAHMARHRAESGEDGLHFMPFARDDPDGPRGVGDNLGMSLSTPGWKRCWVARERARPAEIIGHVDLKGHPLRAAAHRCELGIGIERRGRGMGLGRRLMAVAMDWARQQPELDYIDLSVFADNARARALYRALGFVEAGVLADRFRLDGVQIDDVAMVLKLRS